MTFEGSFSATDAQVVRIIGIRARLPGYHRACIGRTLTVEHLPWRRRRRAWGRRRRPALKVGSRGGRWMAELGLDGRKVGVPCCRFPPLASRCKHLTWAMAAGGGAGGKDCRQAGYGRAGQAVSGASQRATMCRCRYACLLHQSPLNTRTRCAYLGGGGDGGLGLGGLGLGGRGLGGLGLGGRGLGGLGLGGLCCLGEAGGGLRCCPGGLGGLGRGGGLRAAAWKVGAAVTSQGSAPAAAGAAGRHYRRSLASAGLHRQLECTQPTSMHSSSSSSRAPRLLR